MCDTLEKMTQIVQYQNKILLRTVDNILKCNIVH